MMLKIEIWEGNVSPTLTWRNTGLDISSHSSFNALLFSII